MGRATPEPAREFDHRLHSRTPRHKRGGAFHITQLPDEFADASSDDVELTRLSDALDELAQHEPRLAEVVDLRYFCGYTFEEIAAQRGTSTRTVQHDWEKARVLLFQHLAERG